MKTKSLMLLAVLFLANSLTNQTLAQNFTDTDSNFTSFLIASEGVDLRTFEISLDDEFVYDNTLSPRNLTEYEAQEDVVAFTLNMIAFGVGFGFTEFETLWCLHAEYYMRLALIRQMALYGALGIGYSGIDADSLNTNLFEVTAKLLMFSILAKQYQQVRLLYGIFGRYAFGNNKFTDGFKLDVTRLTIGLVVGLQILLSTRWSLMLQTDLFSYQEQTTKADGVENTSNTTWALINKNNILALSLLFTF